MVKKSILILILLLSGIILAAGCTGPVSPGVPAPKTTVPVSPSPVVPVPTSTPLESLPNGTPLPSGPPESAFTTMATTRIASDNPYLEYLNFQKRTFVTPIPNCLMENAFPFIANGTGYGIKQVVPNLSAISEEEYEHFLRKYTVGDAENTRFKTLAVCQASATAEPTWNFVEIRLVLDPTNYVPANYTISRNVWSDGKIVAQFPTTQLLAVDEKVILTSYVPLRTDEVDLIDTVGVTYTRL